MKIVLNHIVAGQPTPTTGRVYSKGQLKKIIKLSNQIIDSGQLFVIVDQLQNPLKQIPMTSVVGFVTKCFCDNNRINLEVDFLKNNNKAKIAEETLKMEGLYSISPQMIGTINKKNKPTIEKVICYSVVPVKNIVTFKDSDIVIPLGD